MPAVITTIPSQGLAAAKPTASPSMAGNVDGFLQILQSLKGTVTDSGSRAADGGGTDFGLPASLPRQAGRDLVPRPDQASGKTPSAEPTPDPHPQDNASVALKGAAPPSLPAPPAPLASADGASAGKPGTDSAAPGLPSGLVADSGAGDAVATLPVAQPAQPPVSPRPVMPSPARATPTPAPVVPTRTDQASSANAPASTPAVPSPSTGVAMAAPGPAKAPAMPDAPPRGPDTVAVTRAEQGLPGKASAGAAPDATARVTVPAAQATPAPVVAARGETAGPLPASTPVKAARVASAPPAAARAAPASQASPEPAMAAASAPASAAAPVAASAAASAAAQPPDSAQQQPPATPPASPSPLSPAPPPGVAKDPATANRVASSDKSPRHKQPAAENFNDPPVTTATQPAVAAMPSSSASMPSPPQAMPPASTSPASVQPGGSRSTGPAHAEAASQSVASAAVANAGASETPHGNAAKEPAVATSAPAIQALPEDARTATPPQKFPVLAETAAANMPAQPATDPMASFERKESPRAAAAAAPLRADPLDLSAQGALGLPAAPNQPAPAAASASAASTHAPAPATPPPPAAQLAPALLSLGQGAEGGHQMTLRLHPDDLGMVQVRIDKSASGVATVEITVEKADTMQALLRDQAQLHHTLDQAGVSSVGRTITFTMAPDASLASDGGSPNPGQGNQHGSGNGTTAGADHGALGGQNGGGQASGGRSGGSGQDQGAYSSGRRNAAETLSPAAANQTAAGKWLRVGLNITA